MTDHPHPGSESAIEAAPAADPLAGQPLVEVERDGVHYVLLGTAHVSRASVDAVQALLAREPFDAVAVELCDARHRALTDPDAFSRLDIFQVIRQGKAMFLLAQLVLQSFYRRLGKQLEVEPGAEMLAGAACAEETGARLELIDRRIDLTLKRVWRHLGFWQRVKLFGTLASAMFSVPGRPACIWGESTARKP